LWERYTIRNVILEEVVLQNLREAIAYVSKHEKDFIREAQDLTMRERDRELAAQKDTLAKAENRFSELDTIIKRLYEDIYGKGRMSNSSNIAKAAGSSVAV